MDKGQGDRNRWSWLPGMMPGVAKLLKERRAAYGEEHVKACWEAGVIRMEPGWFFAREGALAVGTPWDHPDLANFAAAQITRTQALLMLREPAHGA